MKETIITILFSVLFGLGFGYAILACAEHEDQLVEKHCGHLTGYEYGVCQETIY